jgi:NAD-dependent SIR2 family protein deacetylase
VAALERAGLVTAVITQNVDGLHQAGGSHRVVDLHGRLDRVVCLACRRLGPRADLEARLRRANPVFAAAVAAATGTGTGRTEVNPDGDIDLPEHLVRRFVTVPCRACGADALKPDVVFFGENVPPRRVTRCTEAVDRARALLVLGSSLTVMSGYRFVLRAHDRGVPVAIVNSGPTRGDGRAAVRLDAALGGLLSELATRLTG